MVKCQSVKHCVPESKKRIEFSPNIFTEFSEFSDEKYYIVNKLFKPAISRVRHQDVTTVPARQGSTEDLQIEPIHASVIYQIP